MPDSTDNSSGDGLSDEEGSTGNPSTGGPSSGGGPGGPPIGDLGVGGGPSGGDGAARVTLTEAAQATEDVLEGCRRELRLLRRLLRGQEDQLQGEEPEERASSRSPSSGPGEGQEGGPSPRERALRVASRLEACAGALRNASTPRDQ